MRQPIFHIEPSALIYRDKPLTPSLLPRLPVESSIASKSDIQSLLPRFIFHCLLLACLLTSCHSDDDTLTPRVDFSSPYVLTDGSDPIQHERFLIYQEFGVPVFFNDTLSRSVIGKDLQGNDRVRCETLDLNWEFTSHTAGKTFYAFDYIEDDADRLNALKVARQFLGEASRKMRPFSLFLVDSVSVSNAAGTTQPEYVVGFRTLVLSQFTGLPEDSIKARSHQILIDMVKDKLLLNTELMNRFGEVSNRNHWYDMYWVDDLGCQPATYFRSAWGYFEDLWNEDAWAWHEKNAGFYTGIASEEEFNSCRQQIFAEIGRFGFICGNIRWAMSYVASPASISEDYSYYIDEMLHLGKQAFEERYCGAPLVKEKFDMIIDYLENELEVYL